MSDSSEARREQALQSEIRYMQASGWEGIDPEVIERFANNKPAGFRPDWNFVPGQPISPDQLQSIVDLIRDEYQGGAGMTIDRYLADPRAVVRMENGQYVYRPELSSVAKDGKDWYGIDRSSGFWDGFGPFGLALAGIGMPFAASLGAAGAAAGGGAAEGAAAGGAMDMGVGLGGNLGSWGGMTPLAEGAAAAGGTGGGLMQSLAQAATGTGGLTQAELAALIESGTTGAAGAALETAGGLGTASLGNILSTGLANATGIGSSVVNGASSLLNGAGAGGAAGSAGSTAATSASTAARLIKQMTGIDVDPSTLDLLGKVGGIGLGMYASDKVADNSKALFDSYMSMGAPYRTSLAQLEANPEGFYKSPLVQGALQQGSDALARSLSAKVGNPILNPTALQEMQNFTTRGLLDAYNNRFSQLASAGQLGTRESASLGTIANQAQGTTYNALGAGIQSVFGNQRDYTSELLDVLRGRRSFGSTLLT